MAEAARVVEVKPRRLSFTGALHPVRSFEESHLYDPTRIEADLPRLLELIGKKRVGDRPDRYPMFGVAQRNPLRGKGRIFDYSMLELEFCKQ